MCHQRTRDSPVLPFGGVFVFCSFGGHNENHNEREALSGVPNILRPLHESGVNRLLTIFLSRVRKRCFMCHQRTRDSPVLPFGGVFCLFGGHNENHNEREALSGVPNILRPLHESGVIEDSAAASAAAGLPTAPAPAQ